MILYGCIELITVLLHLYMGNVVTFVYVASYSNNVSLKLLIFMRSSVAIRRRITSGEGKVCRVFVKKLNYVYGIFTFPMCTCSLFVCWEEIFWPMLHCSQGVTFSISGIVLYVT